MKQSVPVETHALDEFGHLVRLENESDEDYATRTATVLHQSGASANHPDDVAASNAPTDPPVADDEQAQYGKEGIEHIGGPVPATSNDPPYISGAHPNPGPSKR